MNSTMFRMAIVLGLLSAIGPFTIDMYLPAMPDIGEDLGASVSDVQLTLTLYFLAFGVSQLFYGPMADAMGRKPPIYLGIAIFTIGTVICAIAPTVGWLIAGRFVQGLGAAAVMVIPRAVIRDTYRGADATRLMAMIMLVISVSPMLAPLAGAGMMLVADWRGIFWVLVGVGAMSLAVAIFGLPETLAKKDRVPVNVAALWRAAKVLVRDPVFMGLTFVGGFGMASFFVFIASASFVYSEQFGLTPTQFSLAFAINAIGFFAASQFAGPLGARFGMVGVIRLAVILFAVAAVANLLLVLAGMGTLAVIVAGLFLGNVGLGLVIPSTMVMALEDHGDIAGLASSLGGTLQMVAGGVMITLTAPFFNATALPMIAAIAVCAVLALVTALLTLPRLAAASANAPGA
jgi:MFS transporter, DHA1 family, multidrug resistance protein